MQAIIVDGTNLACEGQPHGRPSMKQLLKQLDCLAETFSSARIHVFLDRSTMQRIGEAERAALRGLLEHGHGSVSVAQGAAGQDTHVLILEEARDEGAIVVSNDNYEEFQDLHPWLMNSDRVFGASRGTSKWRFLVRTPVARASRRPSSQTDEVPPRPTERAPTHGLSGTTAPLLPPPPIPLSSLASLDEPGAPLTGHEARPATQTELGQILPQDRDRTWWPLKQAVEDTFEEPEHGAVWIVWAEGKGLAQSNHAAADGRHVMEAIPDEKPTATVARKLTELGWIEPNSGRSVSGCAWEYQSSNPAEMGHKFVEYFRAVLDVQEPTALALDVVEHNEKTGELPSGLRSLERVCELKPWEAPPPRKATKIYRAPQPEKNSKMLVGQIHKLVFARRAHPEAFFGTHEPILSNSTGKLSDQLFADWLDECVPLPSNELGGRLFQKLAENGTWHLTELRNNGSLREWNPFRPNDRWDGRWNTDGADVLRINVGSYELLMVGRKSGIHLGVENPATQNRTYFYGAIVDPNPGTLQSGDQLVKLLGTGRSSSLLVDNSQEVTERWFFEHHGALDKSWKGKIKQSAETLELSFGKYRSHLAFHTETGLWMGDEFGPDSNEPTKIMVFKVHHPSSPWSSAKA